MIAGGMITIFLIEHFMWDWVGSNSGQVQILIAVLALIFAFQGYFKILEQIALTKKQMNIADKINILNLIVENIRKNNDMLIRISELLRLLKDRENRYLNNGELEKSTKLRSNIAEINGHIDLIEHTNNNLLEVSKKLYENKSLTVDEMNQYLQGLYEVSINSVNVLSNYELFMYDLNNV